MNAEQGTAEWHDARGLRVTGSRIGAVLGVSPLTSRRQMMRDMADWYFGNARDISHLPPIQYGVSNEPRALEDLEMILGEPIIPTGFHPLEDWGGASPDGLISGAVVEVKCPYKLRHARDCDFAPLEQQPHYWHQVQAEMAATGLQRAVFFQWSPHGHKLETVDASPDWVDGVRGPARDFLAELRLLIEHREKTGDSIPRAEQELADLLEERDRIGERINELRDELFAINGCDYDGNLVSVSKVIRKGSIDYAAAAKSLATEETDFEQFRRAGTESLTVRRKKQETES
ncbi:MAG: lambda exonuclease family protein [Wenzhouxiangella sp.]|jgi:putative phage-type endonuclease|nr:lambda exonuclease family protein [Wenzhouxiangella sp.]